MSFKKNRYIIVKKAISKDLSNFLYNYVLVKKQVARTLIDKKYISPFEHMFGIFGDSQVPYTYGQYADIAMETLLLKVQPVLEKHTDLKVVPTYSYFRIYKKGDLLARHKDRASCEVSCTLNLGGDPWSIYLDTSGQDFVIDKFKNLVKPGAPKGIKINLKPGDMLIYRGDLCEHWRDYFNGENHAQVFLHYNNAKRKNGVSNIYDGRIHLGLTKDPMFLRKKEKND